MAEPGMCSPISPIKQSHRLQCHETFYNEPEGQSHAPSTETAGTRAGRETGNRRAMGDTCCAFSLLQGRAEPSALAQGRHWQWQSRRAQRWHMTVTVQSQGSCNAPCPHRPGSLPLCCWGFSSFPFSLLLFFFFQ